jgi:hypothetical protein
VWVLVGGGCVGFCCVVGDGLVVWLVICVFVVVLVWGGGVVV